MCNPCTGKDSDQNINEILKCDSNCFADYLNGPLDPPLCASLIIQRQKKICKNQL